MTSWIDWELNDDEATNPLGQAGDFTFNVEYEFDPGDPGYMYDANGDGYPGYAACVDLTGAVCTQVHIDAEQKRAPTPEEAERLANWFWTVLDKNPKIRDQIETQGLEQMSFEAECDD